MMKVLTFFVLFGLVCMATPAPAPQFLRNILGGGASNSNAASQSFNTGINIPGIFGARFGASNAAANAGSAGIGGGGLGASNSNAAAQSVGAGINVLGIDLGWNAANSASHSGGGFLGR